MNVGTLVPQKGTDRLDIRFGLYDYHGGLKSSKKRGFIMKYISIGAVMTEGTEHILDVTHGGNKFRLTGEKAAIWLNGRCKFAIVAHPSHLVTLEQLFKMGLVVKCDGSGAEEYRALTKCTLVPAESKHPYFGLWGMEKTVLQWLRSAGLVLSIHK